MRIAYFDCFSGISGDMTLGALVDAGLDHNFLENELAKLKLEGYRLNFDRAEKHGIAGTNLLPVSGRAFAMTGRPTKT